MGGMWMPSGLLAVVEARSLVMLGELTVTHGPSIFGVGGSMRKLGVSSAGSRIGVACGGGVSSSQGNSASGLLWYEAFIIAQCKHEHTSEPLESGQQLLARPVSHR